jgi:hypothetical protein
MLSDRFAAALLGRSAGTFQDSFADTFAGTFPHRLAEIHEDALLDLNVIWLAHIFVLSFVCIFEDIVSKTSAASLAEDVSLCPY